MAVVAVFSVWLGRLDLMDPDEGRHSEIAREMLAGGHYLTPRIHGEPYYDKPALFYWTLSSSFAAFGETATAARLPSAVSALLTVAATAYMARLAYGAHAAMAAALVLATTLGFVAVGRHTIVDMPFTAALTVAVAALARTVLVPGRTRSPYPFYLAMGLAILLKGPVALVLLGALALVAALTGSGFVAGLAQLKPLRGAALVAALVVPWYLAAWFADPDYIETFLVHHNLARYTAGVSSSHDQPWYYYGLALPLFALPWTPVMAVAVLSRMRKDLRTRADLLLGAWALLVVGFFWPARTKLVTYMLPALPALAAMAGAWLVSARESSGRTVAALAMAGMLWTMLMALVSLGLVAWLMLAADLTAWFLVPPLLALSLALAASRWRSSEHNRRLPLAVAASTLCLLASVYGGASAYINQERSMRGAAAALESLGPGARLFAYRCSGHSLAFYAGRPVPRTDEAAEALARLGAGGPVALVTKEKHLGELELGSASGMAEIWRGAHARVVVGGQAH